MTTEKSNAVDPDLLSILRCPLTRSALRQEGDFLVAEVGGLKYPVREGIPVMLVEEAQLPADANRVLREFFHNTATFLINRNPDAGGAGFAGNPRFPVSEG